MADPKQELHVLKIAVVPGQTREIAVNCNTTIAQAIGVADLGTDGSGYEIRQNGNIVDDSAIVSDGDQVTLVKKITGN